MLVSRRSVHCLVALLFTLLFLSPIRATPPASGPAADYLQALLRFEPWAESTWHDDPKIPNAGYFGDGQSNGNGAIRGSCGVALGYAVLVRAFPDAPERAHRFQRVQAALRYAAMTHASGPSDAVDTDGKKWGMLTGHLTFDPHGFQSPLWAGTMALTAILLEKDLDPDVVKGCKRVVAAEADVLVANPPSSGFKGDTKCEENAWDTSVPALAAAWMPDDPRAKQWLDTAKSYLVNTYTVPDIANDPLKSWVTTQTLYPSFGIENHGFYHPMYHIDGGNSLGDTYVMVRLCNAAVAEELRPFVEHNVLPVFDFLKPIILETGETAYPSGVDWSLHSFEHCNYFAFLSTHFKEPVAAWAEARLSKNILARQAVNGDGRFVGDSCPDGFYREAVEARANAIAYLHHQIDDFAAPPQGASPEDQTTHFDDIGLIFQRSHNQLVTVSYGAITMALVYPLNGATLNQQFIISPNTSSFIGGAGKRALIDFKKTSTGFRAEFAPGSKEKQGTKLVIENFDGAVVFLELPAGDHQATQDEWFLTAIENHPFTGGERTLLSQDGSRRIKERSGEKASISTGWLNVDNWYGVVTAPRGELDYRAASTYNRNGAAEDFILFRPSDPGKPRAAIILPGSSAVATAAVRTSLKWSCTASQCTIDFVRPDGQPVEIREPLKH